MSQTLIPRDSYRGGKPGKSPLTWVPPPPPKVLTCHDLVIYNIILPELNLLVFSLIHLMKNKRIQQQTKAFEIALLADACTPPPPLQKNPVWIHAFLYLRSHNLIPIVIIWLFPYFHFTACNVFSFLYSHSPMYYHSCTLIPMLSLSLCALTTRTLWIQLTCFDSHDYECH